MKTQAQAVWNFAWLGGFARDLRYAVRSLWRSPGFALMAIATLAVGIGVNAAVFAVANTVLFKGFPLVNRNDRILYITERPSGCCVSYPDFEDWRAQAKSFEGMALVRVAFETLNAPGGAPNTYYGAEISANAFQVLGVQPFIGRDFMPADAQPGAAPVAILNHGLWEHRFGKDPGILGRTVDLNGIPTSVIGVMPRGFSFPNQAQDLWTPLVPTPALEKRENRGGQWFAFGRLADGATIQSARVEMQAIGRRLESDYPRTNKGLVPIVRNFNEEFISGDAKLLYEALWVAVGFVLLIACANVANLLLSRAMGRSREISIRSALGARQWQVVRQLLVESLLLSGLGGVLGWWIAKAGVRVYTWVHAAEAETNFALVYLRFTMDSRVFAYLVGVSVAAAFLFGLAPALSLSKINVNDTLKDGGRSAAGGRRGRRLSSVLVAAEMALAVVLLAGAGVMIRSFLNVYTADAGFTAVNILTLQPLLSAEKYSDTSSVVSFYDRLGVRLRSIPGVESVALSSAYPTVRTARSAYELAEMPSVDEHRPTVDAVVISPGYFQMLDATVLSGRAFNDLDRESSLPVVIVNQRFASRHWPGESALGKRLRLFRQGKPQEWRTVVGVVSNVVQDDVTRQKFDPVVYVPFRQRPEQMIVLARTRVPPASLSAAFRREVYATDPNLAVIYLQPLAEFLQQQEGAFRRNIAVLLLVFAGVALLLASIGLYAVIAHSVSRRTQEIGIRAAMGATARDIRELVLRQGMLPLGMGLGIGLAASFAVNRLLESQLVGVSPADPVTLVGASGVLIAAAVLGCLIPARRAMHVDPVIALRHE